MEVKGLEEVLAKLRDIDEKTSRRHMRNALRSGGAEVRKRAAAAARALDDPASAEKIYRNIGIQYAPRESRRGQKIVYRFGVRGGARSKPGGKLAAMGELKGAGRGNPGGDTWYWRLLEFGTSKMAARPFLVSSARAAEQQFLAKVIETLQRRIFK